MRSSHMRLYSLCARARLQISPLNRLSVLLTTSIRYAMLRFSSVWCPFPHVLEIVYISILGMSRDEVGEGRKKVHFVRKVARMLVDMQQPYASSPTLCHFPVPVPALLISA